ncbi:winged helix DNA-binding domain-containing protein [Bailinhaonella thermotolerans]|uniref:Winged helix DNA-binding domain-containing protein n=1 Tax=Bailinhaonella thermotolerans TaxID=1070861 RepID=A0A3A4B077_9ACTN|nr:winged helix DNA-binding domain-containing protein [Bailinhaonella thermotolerans]RJL33328.1 winged helix DNA-binding domain-containing protein [Bailinhaonella thermotolerans]
MRVGARALNRATMERQFLSRRVAMGALEAVEYLVGLQAQAPFPPYYGLWSRLEGFEPGELSRLLVERQVVRIAVMRGTVHLVSARDCLGLRALTQPVFDAVLHSNSAYSPVVKGVDFAEVAAAARELLEEGPMTGRELEAALAARWPGREAGALARTVRFALPLVQVPPRGVWGRSGQPVLTTAEAWLGEAAAGGPSAEEMVLRYLAAFGPATVADMQKWSGLTRLREVVERLRPRLRIFQDERGRELFDVPGAPLPDPDLPLPPRLVAEYDNVLLAYADKTRVLPEAYTKTVFTKNAVIPGTVFVDGMVAGTWKIASGRRASSLTIRLFEPIPDADREALAEEGERMLEFAAPEGSARDLVFE